MPFPLVGRDLFEGEISFVLYDAAICICIWIARDGGMVAECNESELHFFMIDRLIMHARRRIHLNNI